jgi:hypothetical protein
MTDAPAATSREVAANAEFGELASEDRIAAASALETNGIRSLIAESGNDARRLGGCLLPDGAEVFNNSSRTLESIGAPRTSNNPAAISRSGPGCGGWTGRCSSVRCGRSRPHPTMSSAVSTR